MGFILLFSKQAKPRLQKWFTSHTEKTKKKMFREVTTAVLSRGPKMCAFIEHKGLKLVYKRYASLYFCCGIEEGDNELLTLGSSTTMWSCWTNTSAASVSWTSFTTTRRLT